MENEQNTNEINNIKDIIDSKSDYYSKDLSANIKSSNSVIQLRKDLNMHRGKF